MREVDVVSSEDWDDASEYTEAVEAVAEDTSDGVYTFWRIVE